MVPPGTLTVASRKIEAKITRSSTGRMSVKNTLWTLHLKVGQVNLVRLRPDVQGAEQRQRAPGLRFHLPVAAARDTGGHLGRQVGAAHALREGEADDERLPVPPRQGRPR